MTDALTLDAAKAYVVAYHLANEEIADIEGCGIVSQGDVEVAKLNVTVTCLDGSRVPLQWDVWFEPLCGALYGEC